MVPCAMRRGKDRRKGEGELRYIRIWQGRRGIESDGKMGRQGNPGKRAGSIELNWDCLSNFKKSRPLFFSVWVAPRKCDLF